MTYSADTFTSFDRSRGQALLIVLLSMAVILTVVLSILSLTTTDIAVSEREEESFRAFSAAEAGIEQALLTSASQAGTFGSASYTTDVTNIGESLPYFNYPTKLKQGDTMTIWFISHQPDGSYTCAGEPCFTGRQMRLCWGDENQSASAADTPALSIGVYYKQPAGSNPSDVGVSHDVTDPNTTRISTNSFSQADTSGCTIDGKSYPFSYLVDFSSLGIPVTSYSAIDGLQFARVRFLYNESAQPIGVDVDLPANSGSTLPSQGLLVNSVGESSLATRRISVYELYPDLPSIVDVALFSSATISK